MLVEVIIRLVILEGLVVGVLDAVAVVGLAAGLVELEPLVQAEGLRELVEGLGGDV